MKNRQNNSGFSLVELAIVIVIIGLIVAAITTAKGILETAGQRSMISELSQYKTAINSFYSEYSSLPGDLSNAESYWGASVTTNGNGDSKIEETIGEDLTAWQHLGLANLIEGNYTGVLDAGKLTRGINIPASKFKPASYWLNHRDTLVYGIKGNNILIGTEDGTATLGDGVMEPIIAEGIDRKIDDGLADAGDVYAINGGGATTCVTSTDPTVDLNSSYIPTNTAKVCQLIYWIKAY